jgi:hypothetical protein
VATSDLTESEIDLAIDALNFCVGALSAGDLEALVGGSPKEARLLVDRLEAPATLVDEPLNVAELIILKNALLNEEDQRTAESTLRVSELQSRRALYIKLRSYVALRFEP